MAGAGCRKLDDSTRGNWGQEIGDIPAKLSVIPGMQDHAKSLVVPANFSVLPAKLSVIPTKLSVIPTKLSVIPAKLSVIPAKLSVVPAQAGTQCLLWLLLAITPVHAETDPQTGLVIAPGYEQVKAQCTTCHSGRLVAQNRADRDGWRQMIRWMQETQNLWPLGDAEEPILDYLATNYGPLPRGRRAPLDVTFVIPAKAGIQ